LRTAFWRNVFKVGFDDVVACLSQSLCEGRAVPFEFAQSGIAARLNVHEHPIDPLKAVDVGG
jgi:hypothetical protein